MLTKVVKFGGSSLADAAHFRRVADIIRSDPARRFVVPSAPGKRSKHDTKVTDMLYRCYEMIRNRENIEEYYKKITHRYNTIIEELGLDFDISGELEYIKNAMLHASGRDFAASRGEYLNGLILAKYLGFDFVDAETVIFFRENGSFDEERTNDELGTELKKHKNAVIPGFYGCMPNGTVKTFTRGGSDVTGSIVARAVGADLYENWTDVSGFLMADPRVVENPPTIETITYRELRELAYMGATVLHDEAIFPVRYTGIPINIRNTNAPDDPGTMIVREAENTDPRHVITGIAGKRNFSVIAIEKDMMNNEIGFGMKVLKVLSDLGLSFEHFPSGIDTMSIIINAEEVKGNEKKILAEISKAVNPDNVSIETGLSLIAVVGRGMVRAPGTASRIFSAIAAAGVNVRMIDQGSSEINIIIGVDELNFSRAIRAIYEEFESDETV